MCDYTMLFSIPGVMIIELVTSIGCTGEELAGVAVVGAIH